jgi:predicted XRE-type DNA-binding protein
MTDNFITRGTGNVFADLGLPDAGERQTKTRLALALNRIIKERGLKQIDAARLLGIPQPKVSALVNYRLDGFSVEKLMEFIVALGRDVEIIVRLPRGGDAARVVVLEAA